VFVYLAEPVFWRDCNRELLYIHPPPLTDWIGFKLPPPPPSLAKPSPAQGAGRSTHNVLEKFELLKIVIKHHKLNFDMT
jgi:hypothetical protein